MNDKLITVNLPYLAASKANGRHQEVFLVSLIETLYDGAVCVTGSAVGITCNDCIPLPPYIAEKDIKGFISAKLGVEHGVRCGAKLD